jgi:hypothetical protein
MTGNMTRPERMGEGNFTAFGNTTQHDASGYGNMTGFRNMTRFGPDNTTALNVTFCPRGYPDNESDTGNWTGVNLTGCIPMDGNATFTGNMTHGQFPGGDNNADGITGANGQGRQSEGQSSGQIEARNVNSGGDQDQSDSDLIAAFLTWLKSGGSS